MLQAMTRTIATPKFLQELHYFPMVQLREQGMELVLAQDPDTETHCYQSAFQIRHSDLSPPC
jgi:hypothetical protein